MWYSNDVVISSLNQLSLNAWPNYHITTNLSHKYFAGGMNILSSVLMQSVEVIDYVYIILKQGLRSRWYSHNVRCSGKLASYLQTGIE